MELSRQEYWSGLPFSSPMHESEKWKVKSLGHVWLLATPWTAAHQAPPSMGFSSQEYWSGVPLPSLDCTWERPLKSQSSIYTERVLCTPNLQKSPQPGLPSASRGLQCPDGPQGIGEEALKAYCTRNLPSRQRSHADPNSLGGQGKKETHRLRNGWMSSWLNWAKGVGDNKFSPLSSLFFLGLWGDPNGQF